MKHMAHKPASESGNKQSNQFSPSLNIVTLF